MSEERVLSIFVKLAVRGQQKIQLFFHDSHQLRDC